MLFRLVLTGAALGLLALYSCEQKRRATDDGPSVATAEVVRLDTFSIDLLAREQLGDFAQTTQLTVADDPVFHSEKHYEGIALLPYLRQHIPLDSLPLDAYELVFECEDGYKPVMNVRTFMNATPFLAVADLDAPKGQRWTTVQKGTQEMIVAPFYVVYADAPATDPAYKWPYNLTKIHLVPLTDKGGLPVPTDEVALKGHALFKQHCITCHALNGIGGTMGPELNIPMNITEYWQEKALRAFILNPSSFRRGVKMPTLPYLTEQDAQELVAYLTYMKHHKAEPAANTP